MRFHHTYLFLVCVFLFCISPTLLNAESPFPKDTQTGSYKMLAPLGNFLGNEGVIDVQSGLSTYLNGLFRMGIILATGLAIIMITIGGLKYASTDAINGKSEGKEMIQQALLGLMLALMSVLLLQQINPSVLKSDLDIKEISTTGSVINTNPITLTSTGAGTPRAVDADYGKGALNPMINTGGVNYTNLPSNAASIGGGAVAIDYDGSPGVYRVEPDPEGPYEFNGVRYRSVGYEDLRNAQSRSGAWVGVQTNGNGVPIINSDGTLNAQLSWGTGTINGNETPFVALSSAQYAAARSVNPNFKLGDTVYLTSNGRTITAVYADNAGKRATDYSEVSPAAAAALGIPFNRRGVLDNNADIQISVPTN